MVKNGMPLAFEHRVVAERKIGRYLTINEHVHHIDRDPHNNSPDNLQVMTTFEHRQLHAHHDPNHPVLFDLSDVAA